MVQLQQQQRLEPLLKQQLGQQQQQQQQLESQLRRLGLPLERQRREQQLGQLERESPG
jgi:hypothetical protein